MEANARLELEPQHQAEAETQGSRDPRVSAYEAAEQPDAALSHVLESLLA